MSTLTKRPLEGVNLLVVEDDEDTRQLYEAVFGLRGALVTSVSSVSDAIVNVEQKRPDLVVSDLYLGDGTGYELIEAVRGLGAARGGSVPAIAISGSASEKDRRRCLMAGYQDLWCKPVSLDAVVDVMASLLAESRCATLKLADPSRTRQGGRPVHHASGAVRHPLSSPVGRVSRSTSAIRSSKTRRQGTATLGGGRPR